MSDDMILKAGEQSADDPMEFVLSTDEVDRMGDIIVQDGWDLTSFVKNPIALWAHSSARPIGTWADVRVEGTRKKKLIGRLKLAKAGTSRLIDELRSLIEQRVLRAVSVGFQPKAYERILGKDGNPTGGLRFLAADLMECSLVAVPANPGALSLAKSLDISDDTLIAAFAASGVDQAAIAKRLDRARVRVTDTGDGATTAKAKQAIAKAQAALRMKK